MSIEFLARHWIPQHQQFSVPAVRQSYGMLCSIVGIVLNLLLFGGKLAAGLFSGSVAITADAFNNLSDSGSSLVTLLGFRLAGQKPDRDHPFGHGRMEYLSGLMVAGLIFLMGIELAKSSLAQIRQPQPVRFSFLAAAILGISILVKLGMWRYNRRIGRKIDSAVMRATAADSLCDSIATAVVLVATVAGAFLSFPIDGWCGAVVSLFILWAGFRAARDTISPLLGQPPEPAFVAAIEKLVLSEPLICGIHDLVVHNYGPGRVMISLHAEVPAHEDLLRMHDIIDNIEMALRRELNCEAVIHMYPIITDDALTAETRRKVQALLRLIDDALSIHDFRIVTGPTHTNVIFDAVVPYGFRLSDREVAEKIRQAIATIDGNYFAVVKVERSYV